MYVHVHRLQPRSGCFCRETLDIEICHNVYDEGLQNRVTSSSLNGRLERISKIVQNST